MCSIHCLSLPSLTSLLAPFLCPCLCLCLCSCLCLFLGLCLCLCLCLCICLCLCLPLSFVFTFVFAFAFASALYFLSNCASFYPTFSLFFSFPYSIFPPPSLSISSNPYHLHCLHLSPGIPQHRTILHICSSQSKISIPLPFLLYHSNVAVIASSHFGTTGLATAVGEQPIKGLLCNKAQARMTAGNVATV